MVKGWHGESRRHGLASRGIKTKIQKQIQIYGQKPCDINLGNCQDFAHDLAYELPSARVSESDWDKVFVNKKGKTEWIPSHFWVTYKGRHYDAETPQGVKDYHDLPIFKRAGVPKDIDFLIDWGEEKR